MLSPEQCEEILGTLKARFEKNMNRHEGLEWDEVQARLETNMIVQRKVRKAAEVFVTTVKRWSQGKQTNHKTMLLIWLLTWVLRF